MDKYSTTSLANLNANIMESLHNYLHEAGKESSSARRVRKTYFDYPVKHTRVFKVDDTWYLNERPDGKAPERRYDLGRESIGRIDAEQLRYVSCGAVDDPTATINVDEVHNVVAFDRAAL